MTRKVKQIRRKNQRRALPFLNATIKAAIAPKAALAAKAAAAGLQLMRERWR